MACCDNCTQSWERVPVRVVCGVVHGNVRPKPASEHATTSRLEWADSQLWVPFRYAVCGKLPGKLLFGRAASLFENFVKKKQYLVPEIRKDPQKFDGIPKTKTDTFKAPVKNSV